MHIELLLTLKWLYTKIKQCLCWLLRLLMNLFPTMGVNIIQGLGQIRRRLKIPCGLEWNFIRGCARAEPIIVSRLEDARI